MKEQRESPHRYNARAAAIAGTLGSIAVALPLLATALSTSEPSQERASLREVQRVLPPDTAQPALDYRSLLAAIESERSTLATDYANAHSNSERQEVLERERVAFASSISERLGPAWVGTEWDFNGTTQTPRRGAIACGYFVTTLLRDAGLPLDRVRLAQQPSETIIRRITSPRSISRYSNLPIRSFVDSVRARGPGLSIVGLDCHVGFLVCTDTAVLFIHSSYVAPRTVVVEPAERSPVLAASRYRVVGRLSDDDAVLLRWLRAERRRS